ncbi:MAG: hypothetical protein M1338_05025 [Patescibacteria group bacterium]|nr:hypothetical protein [Patescibacteria group bacterium]
MSVRIFLLLIIVGSVLSFISWLVVLLNLDPNQAGFLGLVSFYLSLFLILLGIFLLLGFWLRRKFKSGQIIYQQLATSLRQAIFFSILIIGLALLQRGGVLTWWNSLLFILTLTVLEFFFIVYSRQKKYKPISIITEQDENTNFTSNQSLS